MRRFIILFTLMLGAALSAASPAAAIWLSDPWYIIPPGDQPKWNCMYTNEPSMPGAFTCVNKLGEIVEIWPDPNYPGRYTGQGVNGTSVVKAMEVAELVEAQRSKVPLPPAPGTGGVAGSVGAPAAAAGTAVTAPAALPSAAGASSPGGGGGVVRTTPDCFGVLGVWAYDDGTGGPRDSGGGVSDSPDTGDLVPDTYRIDWGDGGVSYVSLYWGTGWHLSHTYPGNPSYTEYSVYVGTITNTRTGDERGFFALHPPREQVIGDPPMDTTS